jgi:hypothetical protein
MEGLAAVGGEVVAAFVGGVWVALVEGELGEGGEDLADVRPGAIDSVM